MGSHWQDDSIDQLKALHKEGLTFKAIAERIGVTRNTIAGLCRRHKLTRIDPLSKKKKTSSVGSGRKSKRPKDTSNLAPRLSKLVVNPRALKPTPVVAQYVNVPEPDPLRLGILDLTDTTCKWAVEETPFLFCGAPTLGGKSWCPHHYGRVFHD